MEDKLKNLYKMLYSTDRESELLAINIIKEDLDLQWIYEQAKDQKCFYKKYNDIYFNFLGIYDDRIILLHRVRLIFYDWCISDSWIV